MKNMKFQLVLSAALAALILAACQERFTPAEQRQFDEQNRIADIVYNHTDAVRFCSGSVFVARSNDGSNRTFLIHQNTFWSGPWYQTVAPGITPEEICRNAPAH